MLNWLDQRTGIVTMTKEFLTEDVPGGACYWYVFGSATVFAMICQIVTGIFLMLLLRAVGGDGVGVHRAI